MKRSWVDKNGERFSSPEQQRVQALFRRHVRTPCHPRGRIHREMCYWHPETELGQAHHLDYARPFRVVWCCEKCHRDIELGWLKVPTRAIWDYTELLAPVLRPHLQGPRSRGPAAPF